MATPILKGTAVKGNIITTTVLTTGTNYDPATDHDISVNVQARNYININTVTDPIILEALLCGMTDGTDTIGPTPANPTNDAQYIAYNLLAHTSARPRSRRQAARPRTIFSMARRPVRSELAPPART